MSKWKKSWKQNNNNDANIIPIDETVTLKNKMKKIREKRENPKNIVEFENIYEPPQPSSSIIEGMEDKKDGTLDDSNDNITNRFAVAFDPDKTQDPITGLENQLSGVGTALDDLQGLGGDFESMGQDLANAGKGIATGVEGTAGVFKNVFDFDKKSIQSAVNEASSTVEAVTNIIKFVINIFGKKLTALRLQIQIFLLKANKYVKQTITRMANALTGNTATDKEIETFQSQAQKFITLMLVWYFVYNWYYIIFFLEDSDNIRYSFKIGNLKAISTYLYGFFGPGLKPIEIFNSMVVYCQNLKKYANTSVIMIIMFLVFFILVQNDFQTSLLKDFFGALSGKPTPSILSLFNMGVVLWFSFSWFFGKLSHGNFDATKLFVDAYPGGVWSIAFACVMFVLAFLGYFLWIMNVNMPMGMTLLSGYLVLYTFFGVFFYEGFNCFNIFTGISDSITPISPDLTAEACKPDPQFLSLDWFYNIMIQFVNFLKSIASFASASMFEILILLTLLGGISIYRKEWSTASVGKVGIGAFSSTNLSSVFKHLFAWLILINVVLIIIMLIFLVKKYKMLTDLDVGDGSDLAAKDQTLRSRMASKNSSFKSDGPAISSRAQNRIQAQRAATGTETGTKTGAKPEAGAGAGAETKEEAGTETKGEAGTETKGETGTETKEEAEEGEGAETKEEAVEGEGAETKEEAEAGTKEEAEAGTKEEVGAETKGEAGAVEEQAGAVEEK